MNLSTTKYKNYIRCDIGDEPLHLEYGGKIYELKALIKAEEQLQKLLDAKK